ncbi:hypothetical protein WN51_11877 [Melipona quadrifasciata]|uniref:Uncharacterized protein n=1 Tax=Melipona quadrifasciata TaxID=166423 RepID=A0A0N0BHV6_9HYME|nr:hypothetical protein WN51_11877 [Melipona quadrifasciata]
MLDSKGTSIQEYIVKTGNLMISHIKFIFRISEGQVCLYQDNEHTADKLIDNHTKVNINSHSMELISKSKCIVFSNVGRHGGKEHTSSVERRKYYPEESSRKKYPKVLRKTRARRKFQRALRSKKEEARSRRGKLSRRGSQQMASHPLDHLNDSRAWEIYQLPNAWMKDGITWSMEFRKIDAWVLSNGN